MVKAVLLVLLLCAEGLAPETPPVVAIVNGRRITREELAKRIAQSRSMDPERFASMSASEQQRAVTRLLRARVVQELEYQEAAQRGIKVTDAEVGLALERATHAFPSAEAFEKSLSAGGITLAEWRAEMRRALMIGKLEAQIGSSERPEWIQRLWEKSQVWMWQPSAGR